MKIFTFSFLLLFYLNSQAQIVERVQSQVGEEMVSLIDLKNFQKQLRLNLIIPSLLLTEIYKKSELLKDKNKLLDFMTIREMLFQVAQQEKLPTPSKKNIEKNFLLLKGKASHKEFSGKLKKASLNLKSLKEQILIDLKNNFLLVQFVVPKIIISEQDIESYHFNKHNQSLFKSFKYEFVSVSFTEDKKEAVLKKISDKVLDNLEKIAHSLGLEHKNLKLKDKEIQKTFKKELDKLSVSQISRLLIIGDSYYILQLKWKQPQISSKEQKKKEKIEKFLYKKKLKEEIQKWIEKKKTSFFIIRHSF